MLEQHLAYNPRDEAVDTVELLPQLASKHTGIIHSLRELVCNVDEPELFHYEARVCEPRRWMINKKKYQGMWSSLPPTVAFGSSTSQIRAKAKAVGEAVERFCLYYYDTNELVNGSYEHFSDHAIDVYKCALPLEEEIKKNENKPISLNLFSPEKPIDWVKGLSLNSNTEYLIPACFVYVSYASTCPNELFFLPISTGAACARSPEKAVFKGILEVIERDAFMIMWLNRIEPQEVTDLNSSKYREVRDCSHKFKRDDSELRVFLLPTDLNTYVALAVSTNTTGQRHALCSGLSASLDPGDAVIKAMEECAFVIQRIGEKSRYVSKEAIQKLSGALYSTPSTLDKIDFLLKSKNKVELGSLPSYSQSTDQANMEFLLKNLASRNLESFVVNIGWPELENLGLYVYKSIVPGMQPLSKLGYWYLSGKRIYDLPAFLGHKHSTELYLEPHIWA